MSYRTSLTTDIARLGLEADVLVETETGRDDFNNKETDYVFDRTVLAAKTYPNRNTEVEKQTGERMRDNPVFLVPIGPNNPDPPDPGDHLVYDGTEFEVKAHTEYQTHIEFFGDHIIHDG